MCSVPNASPVHCAMLAKELDTEIPAKPRRSISRAVSSAARRRPGVAIRFRAGRGEGMRLFLIGQTARQAKSIAPLDKARRAGRRYAIEPANARGGSDAPQ